MLCRVCISKSLQLEVALKDDLPRWQKKNGMGICFGDCELVDCFTKLRFADNVLLFATTKEQLQKMMCETKILSSQSSSRRKEMETENIKVEKLTREENTKHLGQMVAPRSRIESGLPGRRFTSTNNS